MSQYFVSSTEAGGLRYMSRLEFARTSFPQVACGKCRWRSICDELLAEVKVGESWMVRDAYLASSDGMTVVDKCARNYTDATIPPDVKVLRRQYIPNLLDFVVKPGDPVPRPRERRRTVRSIRTLDNILDLEA